ncbi:hypothetical protein AVW16_11580 [Crenobacter luteus]|uniref:Polysaccharide biosynthesis protein n=1 Tax=Crenobacter luteus TaxID=1452487 RepID=A0A163CHC6_9NEIS|nr:hypothetical protein AVW16_11580 [Crenobacter luteus]
MYLVGLDFYTYTTREILKASNEQRGKMLKGQAALSCGLYLLLFPIAAVLLQQVQWPVGLALWFIPILVLEHFNQEVSRLLVALSEQLTASIILFVRQGSWALVIVALMAYDKESRNLHYVMASWAVAGVLAASLGLFKLGRLQLGGWRSAVDWRWVKKGIAISMAFLLATLALRGFQTIDRYWLESLAGIEVVASYVLFLGVAGSLMTLLDAGFISYAYPNFIKLYHQQKYGELNQSVRKLVLQTLFISAAFAIVSWLLLPYLLTWIAKPVYVKHISLYPWLLLAMVVNAFSMAPHFALYAQGKDKPIIYSHVAALIAFVASVMALQTSWPLLAVPIALNVSFAVVLAIKAFAYFTAPTANLPTAQSQIS